MTVLLKRRRGRGRAYPLAAALVYAWSLLYADASALAAGEATTHTVIIDGVKYEPEILSVKRGDAIVWVNKDPFPHTVTAKGAFNSGEIAAGKSWKYTARKPGEYAYTCTLHPNMNGTLKVE